MIMDFFMTNHNLQLLKLKLFKTFIGSKMITRSKKK